MKILMIYLTGILFLTGFNNVYGQRKDMSQKSKMHHMRGQGMMQERMGGMQMQEKGYSMCPMHKQMMHRQMPMKKYVMIVQWLPNMADQLELNNNQVEKLMNMQVAYQKEKLDSKVQLRQQRLKMKQLLDKNADSKELKNLLEECSTIKIDMKLAAYETANKMLNVLTDQQKEDIEEMIMQCMNRNCMMQNKMFNQ
ncbi:MAG: hypothetical protein ACOC4J_03335 [Bacteroidota bacterium]